MRAVICGGLLLIGSVLPAAAQERGRIGVTMGHPAAVGIVWHVTDSVALRPEFTFSLSSAESGVTETDGSSVGIGLSGIFYMRRQANFATYINPRYAFSGTSTEVETNTTFGGRVESSGRAHTLSGSFGAQYWMGSRFSAFGELGLSYVRSTTEHSLQSFLPPGLDLPPGLNLNPSESRSRNIGIRTGVGVVFYF